MPKSDKLIVKIENVHKAYGREQVLKGISMDVTEGEVVVLVGPSGTGKSTLLRCINQLTVPDSGKVWVNGVELTNPKIDIDKARQHIGMVFQDFNLFNHLTALDNVLLGLIHVLGMKKEKAHDKAMLELKRVGLANKCSNYPGQLSGGQKQRVAIARSLAMEPIVMLFDEPTSALDPELIGEVLTVMKDLAVEGMTMICVTHEIGFARDVCSRIVFMEYGEIIEQGNPDKMLNNPDLPRTRQFLGKISELH
ncbi:MAG: amino acid ABC transporter ATP-binding protein [Anaerolineaceae bacterium]|jgi:polar amino acid transport system ATP-binding protein|nr:amino acid ABC transporter ATP-binding protein [Anaerolineaceae bacterium]